MKPQILQYVSALLLFVGTMSSTVAQEAARLTAPQLFPEKTLAYFRVDDVKKLRQDIDKMWIGKLGNDPDLKPILTEFYSTFVNVTSRIQESIGLNLDELLSIPNGELAIAVLPSDQNSTKTSRRRGRDDEEEVQVRLEAPAVAFLLDAGDEIASVQILLNRIRESLPESMEHTEKKVGELTLHRYENLNRRQERFGYFIDKGVMIAVSDPNYLDQLANVWLGTAQGWSSLAENRRFTSILARCVGTQGERPQVSFFVDPMAMVRQFSPKTATATATLALLPAFGLDGIQGVGGSAIVAPPDFDMISHIHVQLGSPRKSVLGLLRPKSGSTTPEDWVPENVATYLTINWDIASTVKAVEQLYNQFRGAEGFENEIISRLNDQLQVNFRKDILEMFEGRLTRIEGFVRPITVNSGSGLLAVKVKNMEYFRNNVMPRLLEVIETRNGLLNETIGKLNVKVLEIPGRRNNDTPLRTPEICFATHDDYLFISDSRYMIRQVADTLSGTTKKLNESLDYGLIADRITAQLQNKECSAISYGRSEESLQLFYELARDPKNRERLKQVADSNGFLKALLAALEKRDLPPFSVIAKYLAPSGGFLVDDETGLHFMTFSLRRD
jgi:hypothetical protein